MYHIREPRSAISDRKKKGGGEGWRSRKRDFLVLIVPEDEKEKKGSSFDE